MRLTEFEGMEIHHERPLRITTKYGRLLIGTAFSMPGAKRMIRKFSGTNTCWCGHIPGDHADAIDTCWTCQKNKVASPCRLTRSRAMAAAKKRREQILAFYGH